MAKMLGYSIILCKFVDAVVRVESYLLVNEMDFQN